MEKKTKSSSCPLKVWLKKTRSKAATSKERAVILLIYDYLISVDTFILFRELKRLWKFEAKEALKALGFQVIKWVYVQVELNQDSSIQTDSKT